MRFPHLVRMGYPGLVVSIVLLILIPPHFRMLPSAATHTGSLLNNILFVLLMLSALVPIAPSRRALLTAFALGVAVIATYPLFASRGVLLFRVCVQIAFVTFITSHLLRALVRAREADFQTICAAVCFYLLIGLNWAFVYAALELATPGSFTIAPQMDFYQKFENLVYLSYVTIASLGYGDVTPLTPAARTWAFLEAIFGQFFLAVVVARLVAMQLQSTSDRKSS